MEDLQVLLEQDHKPAKKNIIIQPNSSMAIGKTYIST